MKANAGLCAMIGGLAVILAGSAPRAGALVRALGGFTAAIGGLTLFQHLTGFDLGIDTLLFMEPPGAPATAAPGRMGPPASTSFLLLGCALLFRSEERRVGKECRSR